MQPKTIQITPNFAAETRFEVQKTSAQASFTISELLELPLEDQPIQVSINPLERRGIPFSAIND